MLVAALVVPPPVPWAQRQHRWPQRPQWPLLPVLEQCSRALHFRTLKLAKPNTRQLNGAPHRANRAVLGPWGVRFAPAPVKYPFIVPDANQRTAAHWAAAGAGGGADASMGELTSARAPGGQSILQHLGRTNKKFQSNTQRCAAQALNSTMAQGTGGWPGRHWAAAPAAPGPPKVGPSSSGLGQTSPATRPRHAQGRHHLEW